MLLQQHVKRALAQLEEANASAVIRPSIVVGVSGGPDSLAMLHALKELHPPGLLVAAHLNHGFRPSAREEADFVIETAAAWGIRCVVENEDVRGQASERGLSLEEAGRDARYRFFAKIAEEVEAEAVAVGHNADDQAESILMHLLRGSGLAGLRGMQLISPIPGAPQISLLRPLLGVKRRTIEAYCSQHRLRPVIDLSNQDKTFFRNRLRHELIPFLQSYNHQIGQRLRNMAAIIAADYELLESVTERAWDEVLLAQDQQSLILDRAVWRSLSLSERRATLRRAVSELNASLRDVAFRPIELARQAAEEDRAGARIDLPGGLIMNVDYRQLVFATDLTAVPIDLPQVAESRPAALPLPGKVMLASGWTIEAEVLPEFDMAMIEGNRDPWLAFLDLPPDADLFVRGRQPGERFQPLGMGGKSARLKDVMINRKIPSRLRQRWPVVCTEAHAVWLVGHQVDERASVAASSRRVVKICCRSMQSSE